MDSILPSTHTEGLSLRAKMMLLFSFALAALLISGAISLFMMHEVLVGGSVYQGIKKNMTALERAADLKADIYKINSKIQGIMLDSRPSSAQETAAEINKLAAAIDKHFTETVNSAQTAEKHDSITRADKIWKEYFKTMKGEVIPALLSNNVHKADLLMTGIQAERFRSFSEVVSKYVEVATSEVKNAEGRALDSIREKLIISLVGSSLLIVMVAIFSYSITTSITVPLKNCVEFAKNIASGDLAVRLKLQGTGETAELTTALNTMAENIHGMVSRIESASKAISKIDNSLANATRKAVNSAHIQETSVLEVADSVSKINVSVQEVHDGVTRLAEEVGETATSSLEMAATIDEIASNAEKLQGTVDQVGSSIMEMASSTKSIDLSIANLLDALTTTSSSITTMDKSIKMVEVSANASSKISETAETDAEAGKIVVQETIAGMQAIRVSSQITSEAVETLSSRVEDIESILSVIDEVAEQTNLLALNAAIIAAQAGEHGKGFAVVADEIRDLAERTTSSTQEIAKVVKGLQDVTRRAVNAISQAEVSISTGEKLSLRSGAALHKIVTGIKLAGAQSAEIAKTAVEQAKDSHKIRESMGHIEEMVGSIANSSRENARGAMMISGAAERMKDLTIHLRTSTREQSKAGNLIARSTEGVTGMVEKIRGICHSQVEYSSSISRSVKNIEGATASNLQATKIMNSVVTDLTSQIEMLEKEVSGFNS